MSCCIDGVRQWWNPVSYLENKLDKNYQSFSIEIIKLNEQILNSNSLIDINEQLEKISQIHDVYQDNQRKLELIRTKIAIRESELSKRRCCELSQNTKNVTRVFRYTLHFTNFLSIAALATAQPLKNSIPLTVLGIVFAAGTEIGNLAISECLDKTANKGIQASAIRKINLEKIDQANAFVSFIHHAHNIFQMRSNPSTPVINNDASLPDSTTSNEGDVIIDIPQFNTLDEEIKECLVNYKKLCPELSRKELYARVASVLLHQLPSDDPIWNYLKDIKNSRSPDINKIAHTPIPTNYLSEDPSQSNPSTPPKESFSPSESTVHHVNSLASISFKVNSNTPLDNNKETDPKNLFKLVSDRFGLHDLDYIETEGIKYQSEKIKNV